MSNYGNDWRDTDFGEGQERYYGDLSQHRPGAAPGAQGGPERGGGGRGKGALIAVAGVLAVALAAGGAYVATRGADDDPEPRAQDSTGAASSGEPSPSAQMPTRSGDAAAAGQEPVVPGWRVDGGNGEFPVVFDVPPSSKTFKAANGSTIPEWQIVTDGGDGYGFAHPRTKIPLAMTRYAATYRAGNCDTSPTNALAFVGFTQASGSAPDAARSVSDKFLKAMSLKENGTDRVKYSEGTTKTVKVNGGKTSAAQVRTDVPWSRSDNSFCSQHERELVVTSVPTSNGTGTVVASHVKDPSQGVDDGTFDRIINSIRPRA